MWYQLFNLLLLFHIIYTCIVVLQRYFIRIYVKFLSFYMQLEFFYRQLVPTVCSITTNKLHCAYNALAYIVG